MRVAIDLTALLPEGTGVDNYLTHLVLSLGQVDPVNRYRIYVNYEDRRLLDGRLPRNFAVVPLSLRPRPVRLLFQQVALPATALGWNADVVHSPSFIMPYYRGRQRHVLTIYDMTFFTLPECHTTLRRSAFYRRALLDSIRRADLITVPSRSTRDQILEFVPELPVGKIRLVIPGIGEEFRVRDPDTVRREIRRLGLPESYILHVGTIEPRKNLPRLIESYRRVVEESGTNSHLVLAGRLGWSYDDVLSLLEAPGLRGRIHTPGYVSRSDLPWYYAGARLFVYPSLQEGFGFPPLEAMSCGVPTISSLSTSLTENLAGAAELVPPEDVEALAAAMVRLLRDDRLREKRRGEGFDRAARYRWSETARQTLDCYSAVCDVDRGGAVALVPENSA
jgi:glycosyltransferase involved in cell wall biosynthesis